MNRILRLLPAAAFLLLAGCEFADIGEAARFQEDFHFTYEVQPNCRLSVETQNGTIEITSWDKNSVEVQGAKFANSKQLLQDIKIDAHGGGDSVSLRTIVPSGHHFGNAGARYTIHVPHQITLERITSSNGQIRVDGTQGDARLKTSNGNIHTNATAGRLEAITSNSAIEVGAHRGDVDADTSNGRIEVEAEGGRFRADTSNSSIEARLKNPVTTEPIRAGSSNGHITLIFDAAKLPDVKAETSNASIEVRLPSTANARVHASTSNSSITTDFEVTLPAGTHSKQRLEGVIGTGGADISLDTSNGSIKILKGL